MAQDIDGQTAHRVPGKTNGTMKAVSRSDKQRGHSRRHAGFNGRWDGMTRDEQIAGGANARTVWTIATRPYPGAHFAVFPEALVVPCIKAGTSERGVCPECGAPWERETEKTDQGFADRTFRSPHRTDTPGMTNGQGATTLAKIVTRETLGWSPACGCDKSAREGMRTAGSSPASVPCTVLDPFVGSGTTALVARRLGRKTIGVELNSDYCKLAARRLQQLSLLA